MKDDSVDFQAARLLDVGEVHADGRVTERVSTWIVEGKHRQLQPCKLFADL